MTSEPPPIAGVRRSFVEARGVRFHVTEAGPADGRPVLALHGWSGPAPHKWAKEDVASDVLALLDTLGLDRVLLVGHDWGGYVGYRMVLGKPQRFDGYLALNTAHPG